MYPNENDSTEISSKALVNTKKSACALVHKKSRCLEHLTVNEKYHKKEDPQNRPDLWIQIHFDCKIYELCCFDPY